MQTLDIQQYDVHLEHLEQTWTVATDRNVLQKNVKDNLNWRVVRDTF